jgi:hypothetical protein
LVLDGALCDATSRRDVRPGVHHKSAVDATKILAKTVISGFPPKIGVLILAARLLAPKVIGHFSYENTQYGQAHL